MANAYGVTTVPTVGARDGRVFFRGSGGDERRATRVLGRERQIRDKTRQGETRLTGRDDPRRTRGDVAPASEDLCTWMGVCVWFVLRIARL